MLCRVNMYGLAEVLKQHNFKKQLFLSFAYIWPNKVYHNKSVSIPKIFGMLTDFASFFFHSFCPDIQY